MLTRKEIIAYLRQNPNVTNMHLASHFGVTINLMATKLKQYIDTGYISRTEGAPTPTGVTTYLYSAVEGVSGKPKKERVKIAKRTLGQAPTAPVLSLDAIVNELASAITQQVLAKVQRNLVKGIHLLAAPTPKEEQALEVDYGPVHEVLATPEAPKATAVALPKVGVVGLMPQQAGAVSAEFGEALDLVFWEADDSFAKLEAMGKGCEVVFLHVRHISHVTDRYLTGCAARVVRVTGGTSNIRDAIRKYFAK